MNMKKLAIPNKSICVACGVCLTVCPRAAVSICKGCFAQVDAKKMRRLRPLHYPL